MRLDVRDNTHVLVLTGAGISAESGVPTFRDANGLWEGHDVTVVASPEGFANDPRLVWKFYSERRAKLVGIEPNAGHRALVELEQRLGDRFLLVTQNVDGLHRAAGSTRMVEMHGNIRRTKCWGCDREPFHDESTYLDKVPVCRHCNGPLRPDVVWFGEPIAPGAMDAVEEFLGRAESLVFLAVGTSGLVYPAAAFVHVAKQRGGATYLVNLDRPANVDGFDHVVIGPAGRELPALLSAH